MRRRLLPLIIVILLFGTGLHTAWWFRHDIVEWHRLRTYGPLPDAVAYDQVQQQQLKELRMRLIAEIEGRAADLPPQPYVEPESEEPVTPEPTDEEDETASVDETETTAGDESDATDAATEEDAPDEADGTTDEEDASGPTDEELAAQAEAEAAAELQRKRDADLRALSERRSRIGDSYNLAVPFTPQAPYANWDALHNEACEEASAIMIKAFFDGESSLPANVAEERILAVAAWEDEHLGSNLDTTAEETALFMREFLGMRDARVVAISSIEDVKAYVGTGTPVIVPAYGRALGNPYFSGEGPLYHMLVVKGFQDDLIITNDPGTKRGADFIYDADVLWDAIHDWNGGDVRNGKKVMIVAE